jgi:SAM-dependent methyltransferase
MNQRFSPPHAVRPPRGEGSVRSGGELSVVSEPRETASKLVDLVSAVVLSPARRACAAKIADGERVLDLGVGRGDAFESFVRANPHGYTEGISRDRHRLEALRGRLATVPGHYRLRFSDPWNTGVTGSAFDTVVACHLLDRIPESAIAAVLGEARRALVPGGRLIVTHLSPGNGLVERLRDALHAIDPALTGGRRGVAAGDYVAAMGFVDVRVSALTVPGLLASHVVVARRGLGPTPRLRPSASAIARRPLAVAGLLFSSPNADRR